MWSLIFFVIIGVYSIEFDLIDKRVGVAQNVSNGENVNPMRVEKIEEVTEILVETENGPVRGFKDSNEIIGFFDIPYGTFSEEQPFEEPSTPNSWITVLENAEHKSKCPQIDSENKYIGSSTCLTLSIFLQRNTENADVLFHIHDSSLNMGSGNPSEYDPRHLVSKGIILVLPNYRIGPLGFLCLQNETAPGNAGLKDLNLALQWTKKNIKAFGGNDSNIVISGSGGAGALVEYLILSNQSRALISKAITESGFTLSPWALDRYPLETAKSLMKKIAESENNAELENSIFGTPNLEKIVSAGQGLLFKPCIENNTDFLTESPWYILNNEIIRISIMMGSANQAAMEMALAHTEQSLSQLNQDFSQLLPNDLKFDNSEERTRIGRQVKTEYFGETNITMNDMEKLSQCFTDSQYLYPGIRGARLLAKGGAEVYFYEFSYGTQNYVKGAAKGDSLNYVFSKYEEENTLQKLMLDLWVSFIKLGKPTTEKIEWNNVEVVEQTEEVWLSIGDTVAVEKGFHYRRLKQWDEIYEKYFVERNLALKLNSSIYIIVLGSILLKDAPKPTPAWSGIFEATHRVKCPQPDGSGDENCLVVNVFPPENATSLPVIVHFHDGGFQKGWGAFKVPLKLLERSFVFVSFNYRLGVLGFLCLGTETVSGNAGLKDQVAALYWVQRNIAKFGGNPSDITVYGTGAGAASIEILLLSGLTTDLFQKAIIESGSALSPTTITHEPISDVRHLAKSLRIVNGLDAIKDLYQLPVKKLVNSSTNFLPCVEKELRLSHSIIDKDPRETFQSKKYQHVPMMIVYTNAEEVSIVSSDDERFQTIPEDFQALLPHDLVFENSDTKHRVAKLVKDFYFAEIESAVSITQSYVDFINDVFMEYPVVKSAANYAYNGNPVFLMKFMYKGKLSRNKNDNIRGASPRDIFLYFSYNDFKEDYDEDVTEKLVTLWTNFIKLGDPTPLTTPLISEIWQPVVPHTSDGNVILHNIPCLIFNGNMRNEELSGQQYTFWDRIYNKFYIQTFE